MKFNCGKSKEERRIEARIAARQWHRWFAWYPVRVASGDCRWLEYVERRASFVFEGFFIEFVPGDPEYRAIAPKEMAA